MSTFNAVALRLRKTKTGAGERVLPERLLAEPRQAVDPAAEIGRLDGDQDLHLGRDLEHHRASQKLRDSASTSAAS